MVSAYDDFDDDDDVQEESFLDIFGIGETDSNDEDPGEENDGPASNDPCPLSMLLSKEEYLANIEKREILDPLPHFPKEPVGDTIREEWLHVAYMSAQFSDGDVTMNQLLARPLLPLGDYDFGPDIAR